MRNVRFYTILAGLIASLFLGTTGSRAQGDGDSDSIGPTVLITDLVGNDNPLTDSNGIVHRPLNLDPSLTNPWGVGESTGSPFWVSDNASHLSTLYNSLGAKQSLVVSIPTPQDLVNPAGAPTGLVFNIDGGANGGFKISGFTRTGQPTSASAVFLFSSEDGTILGWNPGVNPAGFDPAKAGTYAIIAVDNSQAGAVYKGLAIAKDADGKTFLYATNFHDGTVEVYGDDFKPPTSGFASDAFTDQHLKKGYAPFNVIPEDGKLFVTYAVQDTDKEDDVAGPAHGIVNTFDLHGGSLQRFTQHGHLNSPWGLVKAPASFGQFAGDILIGNFGNGRINAYTPSGEFVGPVVNSEGQPILIDGLWTLTVGNGGNGGDANKVYFTAGPNDEKDGLFGSLTAVAPGTPCGTPCL